MERAVQLYQNSQIAKEAIECFAAQNTTRGRIECAQQTAQDVFLGPLAEVQKRTKKCVAEEGLPKNICLARSITEVAVEKATEAASTALIVSSTPTLLGGIGFSTGAVGLINADRFGRKAGEIMINVVNFLTETVEGETIKSDSQISIRRNDHDIVVYTPADANFIRTLVVDRQKINTTSREIQRIKLNLCAETKALSPLQRELSEADLIRASRFSMLDVQRDPLKLSTIDARKLETPLPRAMPHIDYVHASNGGGGGEWAIGIGLMSISFNLFTGGFGFGGLLGSLF